MVWGMVDMGFDSGFGATYRRRAMHVRQIFGCSMVAALLATSLPAYADDTGTGAADPAATPKRQDELTAKDRKSMRVGTIDASKVSIALKKSSTEKMLVAQRLAVVRGTDLQGEARSRSDIIQLNCVNDALLQIKGLLKLSEASSLAMYEAMAALVQDKINHEYTKVVVAHQKTALLKAVVEQCVGELSVYAGDTTVEVVIDGNITSADPTLRILPPPGPTVSAPASEF